MSVSADGNIIAGFNDPEAYIFNVTTNAYTKIVHPDPEFSTSIVAISDDGNTAIGYANHGMLQKQMVRVLFGSRIKGW